MCTVVLLYRPNHQWPLLLAGNRDEMRNRPALPPGYHWPEHTGTIAGLDQLAGGSWLGMNQHRVTSVVMNREGTLGPMSGKRSRGDLVLQALEHKNAEQAAHALSTIKSRDYRAFNLLIADAKNCYWIKNPGEEISSQVALIEIPPGLHMLTAHELDDEASPRIRTWLNAFKTAATPDPTCNNWDEWKAIMSEQNYPEALGAPAAMNVDLPSGFATVSSTLIALPGTINKQDAVWLFADDAPHKAEYLPVKI